MSSEITEKEEEDDLEDDHIPQELPIDNTILQILIWTAAIGSASTTLVWQERWFEELDMQDVRSLSLSLPLPPSLSLS